MTEFAISASVLRDCDQTVPDFLAKYSDIINKNGRIGIYTKEERVAIVARFREKRKRRVWQKKVNSFVFSSKELSEISIVVGFSSTSC